MDLSNLSWLQGLIVSYGLWCLFAVVMLESMGIPMPGETALVATALYAGSTHSISLLSVVLVAATAATIGDNVGYAFGRAVGLPLVLKYGRYVRLNSARLKIGQYLFMEHGGKIVFFGRFIAVLRTYAALLAGINLMKWRHFLLANGVGGVCWAALFGAGAYFLGNKFEWFADVLGLPLLAAAILALAGGILFVRHHEKELQRKADAALPDAWPHNDHLTSTPSTNN